MPTKQTTDADTAPEGEAVPAATPAASFTAWWDATIPNSAVSRDTAAYNKAHALRLQLLAVLNSVTGA